MKLEHIEPRRLLDDADTPSKGRALLENARPMPLLGAEARRRSAARVERLSRGGSGVAAGSVSGGVVITALALLVVGSTAMYLHTGSARESAREGQAALEARAVPVADIAPLDSTPSTRRAPELVPPAPTAAGVDVASLPAIASGVLRSVPPRTARPAVSVPNPAVPTEAPADVETLAREAKLLEAARKAFAVDPDAALVLLEEHARTYPQGSLGAEREYLAVRALDRVGRRAEAEQRAAQFVRTYPGSPYQPRLRSILEAAPNGATQLR